MRKPLTLTAALILVIALFFFQAPVSSCNKNKTVTDTLTKTIRDTVIKVISDTVVDTLHMPVNLQSGLIAYYPLNGNTLDSTGKNSASIVYGNLQYTTNENNVSGTAALFDGTSTYILVPDNGNLSTDSFTMSVQFYENSTDHQNLVSKINFNSNANSPVWGTTAYGGTGGANTNPYALGFVAKGPSTACGSPDPITVDEVIFSGDSIQLHTWYQLTCTFENGVERMYLNGVLKSAQTLGYNVTKKCTEAQLTIGAWFQYSPLYFSGKMDKIRIYNRALNYREVKVLAKGL